MVAIASQKIGRVCAQWQNLDMANPLLRIPHGNKYALQIRETLKLQGIEVDPVQSDLIDLLGRTLRTTMTAKHPGVYIYGPPGRGKTLIINTLVSVLPETTTARFHFHEFFQRVNSPVNRVPGQPLGAIFSQGLERELAGLQLLVFDEFHCTEPGDAMFMAKLIRHCTEHEIQLVTTSNYGPEKLLDDDTFHHLVQPIIDRIQRDFTVFSLDHSVDYRQLAADPEQVLDGYRRGTLNLFEAPGELPVHDTMIQIGYDEIGPVHVNADEIWISFEQICRTRRNTADYLDLASRYSRWHVTCIPASATMPMDEERRLANLIDIFYDKNVEVHLYAADNLGNLGHMLHDTEKARLTSRLAQLQLNEYERTSACR
ncbi:cell division protein ZapE [Glutamicibacter sp. Je.9.36]